MCVVWLRVAAARPANNRRHSQCHWARGELEAHHSLAASACDATLAARGRAAATPERRPRMRAHAAWPTQSIRYRHLLPTTDSPAHIDSASCYCWLPPQSKHAQMKIITNMTLHH